MGWAMEKSLDQRLERAFLVSGFSAAAAGVLLACGAMPGAAMSALCLSAPQLQTSGHCALCYAAAGIIAGAAAYLWRESRSLPRAATR